MTKYYVLFHDGDNEWYEFDGSLADVIRDVKNDHRWHNYGRNGATIIEGKPVYKISSKTVEEHLVEGEAYTVMGQ